MAEDEITAYVYLFARLDVAEGGNAGDDAVTRVADEGTTGVSRKLGAESGWIGRTLACKRD